ncbi:MAG: protein kinase [Planctomycetes bacterium]|nr:protein kinase [Planctomycetota bacterium]
MSDPVHRPVRATDVTSTNIYSDSSDGSVNIAPSSVSQSTPSAHDTLGNPEADSATPSRIGEYVLLGELGRGGMGVVYRAEDPRLKREVALKVMLPQFAQNGQAKLRFVREARAQAKVEHDHVVAILHIADHEGLPYIVMPLLKGLTLHAALKANPRPPLPEVIRIARETAEGLFAAHEQGLVHRDIKPANIWLEGKKLRVKILDFGLARTTIDAEATEGDDGPLTREGAVVGTPQYMSPEQGRGLQVDGRTDLWSLGVMLYQMTTGELPFRGATPLAILTSLALDNPPPPIAKNPAVPQSLSDFVLRLLAKDPAYRPPTAEIAANELRDIESGFANAVRVIPLDSPPPLILTQSGPDPFADLDATEVSMAAIASPEEEKDAEADNANQPRPTRVTKASTGFPMWAVVAVVLLAVAGVVGFVASQSGKKPAEVVNNDEPPQPLKNPNTQKKETPLVGSMDPDRRAAEYVIGVHGSVGLEGDKRVFRTVDELPKVPFKLATVYLGGNAVNDAGLAAFKDTKNLTAITIPSTFNLTAAGFANFSGNKNLLTLSVFSTPLTNEGLAYFSGCKNLTLLNLHKTKVSDAGLNHLRNCTKLEVIHLDHTAVTDAGLSNVDQWPNLTKIGLVGCRQLTDEAFVHLAKHDNLAELYLESSSVTDAGLLHLKNCKNLKVIGLQKTNVSATAIDELKKALPKCVIQTDADTLLWERSVAAMPVKEQAAAVLAKLKERNPVSPCYLMVTASDETQITGIWLHETSNAFDISPVRAFAGLKSFKCDSAGGNGQLSDISPLKGMKNLTQVEVLGMKVTDLTPLKGMPLTSLNLSGNRELTDLEPLRGMPLTTLTLEFCGSVKDIGPLKGMPLTGLSLHECRVESVAPLKGMKLTTLNLNSNRMQDLESLGGMPLTSLILSNCDGVKDISPLGGMPLTMLFLDNTSITSLEPLKKMPLKQLYVDAPGVSDLTPLKDIELEDLRFTPKNITAGLDIIREKKTLKTIGLGHYTAWPAKEFWERFDKGEFNK